MIGGGTNSDAITIEPAILTVNTWQDRIMREKLAGPILKVPEYLAFTKRKF